LMVPSNEQACGAYQSRTTDPALLTEWDSKPWA
jgi:hypothetical protein